jgi:bifunctional DNA-binding transcriptional regulator/antitoxin component of YhaV-PrlF toxin-antitoxin module
MRKQFGLKKGDLVAVTATPEGLLIIPQGEVALRALDRVGEVLREQGLTLEELIESGRQERARLIAEKYGDLSERRA